MSEEKFYKIWIKIRIAVFCVAFVALVFWCIKAYSKVIEFDPVMTHELDHLQRENDNKRNQESYERVASDENPTERDHERAADYIRDNYN